MPFDYPSIDENNPLYCPSLPAATFLESLRHQVRRTSRPPAGKKRRTNDNNYFLVSFARLLDKSLAADTYDSDSDDSDEDSGYGVGNLAKLKDSLIINAKRGRTRTISTSSEEDSLKFSISIPAWERKDGEEHWKRSLSPEQHGVKRKRGQDSFSDILGPPKYARSIQSVHETSFDVVLKHEKLSYSTGPGSPTHIGKQHQARVVNIPHQFGQSLKTLINTPQGESGLKLRIQDLEDQLYGPPIGSESPRGIHPFIKLLDSMLPGIRLKERLLNLSIISHQSIVDFLGAHGFLNARVLAMFRTSEVRWISLTESLANVDGLNLCGDILPTFSRPNGFLLITELSLRDIRIDDFDLTYILRLPKLSTLLLDNTAISNEAIFLLVPLKRTLTQLSISSNPDINDDAVPALLLLSKLSFLSILDTSIYMPGLRRLAKTIYDDNRIIDIEVPTTCEVYVNEMHTKYELDPRPPLITAPTVCTHLSPAALERNLAVHAAKNSRIFTTGSKLEMVERLKTILTVRSMDMLVREMILGTEEKGTF